VRTFGIDEESGKIDLATARKLAEEFEPHIIIAGSSNYPYQIDFEALYRIGRDAGALLFADIAHVSGLIIAGLHWNPTPSYDVVTTSTHKTFCGPRTGGLVLCKARHAEAIDTALAPGLQAACGGHIVAARAVLFDIVRRPEFRDLMRAVVANAKALAEALAESGITLYAGGTDTHMVVVDLRRTAWTGAGLNPCLLGHGIVATTVNLPALPGTDNRLGLRLGSVPMTIRGIDDDGFRTIAENLARVLNNGPDGAVEAAVRKTLTRIAQGHPAPLG
jgi:glycine hydroxymethyltransferase